MALLGCMGHSSIGGWYGLAIGGDVWGIAVLVGCMGYSSIGALYGI